MFAAQIPPVTGWNPYFVRFQTAQHQSNPINHVWYRVVARLPMVMAYCSTHPLSYLKLTAPNFAGDVCLVAFSTESLFWLLKSNSCGFSPSFYVSHSWFGSCCFSFRFNPHLLTPAVAQWRPLPRQTEWSRHQSAGGDPLAKALGVVFRDVKNLWLDWNRHILDHFRSF